MTKYAGKKAARILTGARCRSLPHCSFLFVTASVVRKRAAIDAAFCSAGHRHLGGVDDAGLEQVLIVPGGGVETERTFQVPDPLDDDATLEAGVDGDLLQRLLHRPGHDPGTGRLVAFELLGGVEDAGLGPEQGDPTAGHDALFDGGLGGGHRVLDAVLLLLQLDLGRGSDLDHRDATGELGQPLLELLTVVVGVGVVDLGLDLVDPALDVRLGAGTLDDGGLVLGDDDLPRALPSMSRVTLSSLRPTSSVTTCPPVRMAMSWSIASRRSPKPGALTATLLNVPRILLTTSVAKASPSTSSAMITSGLPDCMTFSSTGSRSRTAEIFEPTSSTYGSSSDASIRSGSVTKYGEM